MKNSLALSIFLLSLSSLPQAYAATTVPKVICSKNSTGAISLRPRCKRGETKVSNRTLLVGLQGPAGVNGSAGRDGAPGVPGVDGSNGTNGIDGANGINGADGALRIYGDGSAGPLNITSSTSWLTNPPANANLQFSSCAVAASTILTVPSGTNIRCSTTASIAGTIYVLPASNGGIAKRIGDATRLVAPAYREPGSTNGFAAAGTGEITAVSTGTLAPGQGGSGVSSFSGTTAGLQFFSLLLHGFGVTGGGGAASIGTNTSAFGGAGGGAFSIIARQAISITGSINASGGATGSAGAGGGSGGLVIIASAQSIAVTGSGFIRAAGTAGGNSDASVGAGGGGGGGIVQLLAPVIPSQSLIDAFANVQAGTAGSISTPQSSTSIRQAGSGGGGLGGDGGTGGLIISTTGTQSGSSASSGFPGFAAGIAADPASLLIF